MPSLARACGSAPHSCTRYCVTSRWPSWHARYRGVAPFLVWAFTPLRICNTHHRLSVPAVLQNLPVLASILGTPEGQESGLDKALAPSRLGPTAPSLRGPLCWDPTHSSLVFIKHLTAHPAPREQSCLYQRPVLLWTALDPSSSVMACQAWLAITASGLGLPQGREFSEVKGVGLPDKHRMPT